MSQQPPDNSDPQQPDASSRQQADSSIPQNVVKGNQNRAVQGNDNQAVLGDNNTVVQGNNNLMFVIKELIFGQQLAPVGNPAREHNQRLLLADVKQEVTARLRQSLHNAVLINLGKEPQPQQVKRPWDAEIKIGLKPAEPLPDTTTILEVFDSQEIAGKLLILGAPGSGKTTTQLELAQALIKRAEEEWDFPIPVLINLSSWKNSWWQYGKQAFLYWLVATLNCKYGFKPKLLKEWIENRQILPLLDGLDEVKPSQQEKCIQAINHFLQSELRPTYIAICSRIEEYQYSPNQLEMNSAIMLQPLTNAQIEDFLIKVNCTKFWKQIQQEPSLLEISENPLLLSISALVYSNLLSHHWHQFQSRERQLESLLDTYITVMLERPHGQQKSQNRKQKSLEKRKIIQLGWLAKKMQQESQTEFLIEKMQPSLLLTSADKRLYKIVIVLLCGLSGILIGGIALGFIIGFRIIDNTDKTDYKTEDDKERNSLKFFWSSLLGGFIGGGLSSIFSISLVGLILGIIAGLNISENEIEITESFDFSLTHINKIKIRREITNGMKWAFSRLLILCWFYLLIILLIIIGVLLAIKFNWFTPDQEFFNLVLLSSTLIITATVGLVFILGLFFASIRLFRTGIESRIYPNQGIRESVKITVFLSTALLIISTILYALGKGNGELVYFVLPVILEPISDFCFTGVACIQHLALRCILCYGGYTPWNYARFLNYYTERMFLQRVGGRYRFIHKLLQDHFAQMEFKRN